MPTISAVELRDAESGALIRAYSSEAAALAFVRDVARINGRTEAARFQLLVKGAARRNELIAEGEALVRRALEDPLL